jgi:hypothetical protein
MFEYMHIPIKLIPQEIIAEYNLLSLVSDGHVYIEVQKGIYGLPQAGTLTNQLLAHRLSIHGYHQTKFTPGLWSHVTRPIHFTLAVDDFGVQYVGKEQKNMPNISLMLCKRTTQFHKIGLLVLALL